ncbi:MAG: DUF835 domain-containing protein [Candidatus Thermoplasmatota archaeon]|nr:DUF835 domain-containing protein [Candidatus Thermoplasmatota archaeon]MBU3902598.1 DUF835 domain-containing protein [Candidatus Thermoplasmatota archaeon]MBU4189913.1 DUF835 domain-containing protein [Candidatus Thermoplasmatota archaeon]MCG2737644.1 DUF835 domain-containing protein [Candidatus Methanoperedenaceae archaeon]MCG2826784.1 DUF835 domain-containing protein [Thermoplasmatales archaeon]
MVSKRILITYWNHRFYIKQGHAYLVKEEKSHFSFHAFKTIIRKGFKGLCLTVLTPYMLSKKYNVRKTSIIRLGKQAPIRDVWLHKQNPTVLSPTDPGRLVHLIKEFTTKNKESVVLLDALEYLIIHNGFSMVVKVITDINELIMVNKSILFVPINPKAFSEKELALLERNFEIINLKR